MKNKKGQFSFVWLFAIIAGGAILVLAIYGATKAGNTQRFQTDSEIAKSIAIITDPLQAGFAESSFGEISFKQETRINNFCLGPSPFDHGGFGRNKISVSTKSDIGKPWNIPGEATSIYNKYIFSSEADSGKEYYVFSKPFKFPYKVADLTFLTPKNYCFIGAPEKVTEDIGGMNMPNIKLSNCSSSDAVNVCFGSGVDCDIMVYGSCLSGCDSPYDFGSVEKDGSNIKYVGSLMYAAIFSSEQIYNCNVQRLMYRDSLIAREFSDKADLMTGQGCNTNLKPDLIFWGSETANATVGDLTSLYPIAKAMERKNEGEVCGMWN